MPIFVVDKPLHLTSHDVVSRARRTLATKRVGHTGTLDPLATGVLVLCVNDSTKLVQFMEHDSKEYLAWISLGASTPTLDAEGPISQQASVDVPSEARVRDVLTGFVGPQQQIPPQYSALQVGGQRAYDVARKGGTLELPARDVVIHDLELLGVFERLDAAPREVGGRTFDLPPALGAFPTLLVRASVGSGTYIRSLARDVGAALGVPAHLAGLARTRAGKFHLSQACALDGLADAASHADLAAIDLPVLEADAKLAKDLRDGKKPASALNGRHAVTLDGALVAVVDADGERLKVVRAWA